MRPLARDLAARGFAAWNIEYRRVGQEGGGWPGTLEDVAAAADAVSGFESIDPDRVATVGHSAGGHSRCRLAARHRISAGMPGADPLARPCVAVSQAGVADLVAGPPRRSRRRSVPGASRRGTSRGCRALRGRFAAGAPSPRRAAAPRARWQRRHRPAAAEPWLRRRSQGCRRRGRARRVATRRPLRRDRVRPPSLDRGRGLVAAAP